MIAVGDRLPKNRLPERGQETVVRVVFFRYGQKGCVQKMKARYIGMNKILGTPMWDIDTYDEAYAKVIEWEPAKERTQE